MTAEEYYDAGIAHYSEGDYEKAIEAFGQVVILIPNNAAPYNQLGTVNVAQKQYEKAIEAYQQAITLDPEDADPYNGLGNVYQDLKQYNESIDAYQQAIVLDANFAAPHNGLGNIYCEQKQYDSAIKAFRQAIALDANIAEPHNGLGNAYDGQKKYDKAVLAYQRAITIAPNDAAPHNGLGRVYKKLGDYIIAQKHYTRFLFNEWDQHGILKTLPNIIPFFRDYADAPYVLKAIFNRFPYLDHLTSYKKAILQYHRQCETVDAYIDYLAYNTKKEGDDYWYAMALTNYYMGHVAEAYRIYDDVLDRDYDLSLMGQFYYLCAWADYLEPGLEMALFDAIRNKVKPFVCKFDPASHSVTDLYYAGQIYFWAWEQFGRKVFLRAADTVFKRADYFVPAQYMRVLTLQALGDREGMERQIEKVRKEKQRIYQNGFKKQLIDLTKPALLQLKRYAHFREIQASINLIHPIGTISSIPAFYEAWEVELDADQKKKSQDYKKGEAGKQAFEQITMAAKIQTTEFSEEAQQQRSKRLENNHTIAKLFEEFQGYAQKDESQKFEGRLARLINAWELVIPKQASLRKQEVYADFVKYFYSAGNYNLSTMLMLLNYVYHVYVENALKEGDFVIDELKTYSIRSVLVSFSSFMLGPYSGAFVGSFTKRIIDNVEQWLAFDATEHPTGLKHYERFKEYYLTELSEHLPGLLHDPLFENNIPLIHDLVDWHKRQTRE